MQIRGPHTLAERQRRLTLNELSVSTKASYSCPECRTLQYDEVEDLTRNFIVERAVGKIDLSKAKSKEENLCQLHKMPLILCKQWWIVNFTLKDGDLKNEFNLVCTTHKKKLCHEGHFNKLCSGKKECNVIKNDDFQEMVTQVGFQTSNK